MDDFLWFVVAGAVIVGFSLFKIVRYRGVKGAMFGAQMRSTVGELTLSGGSLESFRVKVHRLKASNPSTGPYVGLEIDSASFVGMWEMPPLVLTRAQAQQLSKLISRAAE